MRQEIKDTHLLEEKVDRRGLGVGSKQRPDDTTVIIKWDCGVKDGDDRV